MSEIFVPKIDNVRLANSVVQTPEGGKLKLGQVWQKRPAILIFLRHFACIACRAHAKEVWSRRDEYEKQGQIVFIGNGDANYINEFKKSMNLDGALVLTDPSLESYRAAGFYHGFFYVVQFPTLVNIWKMTRQGHKQVAYTKRAGTHWQLGGVVVVNMQGQVTYQYISESMGDFPEEPAFDRIIADEKERAGKTGS